MASNETPSANQQGTVEESNAEAGREAGEQGSADGQLVTEFEYVCCADGAGLPPPIAELPEEIPTIEVCYWPRPEEEPTDVQPDPDLENFPICGADGAGLPPPIAELPEEIPPIEGGDVSVCPPRFEEEPTDVKPDPDLEIVPICGADGAGLPPPIAVRPQEITFTKEQVDDEGDVRILQGDPPPLPPAPTEEPIEASAEA